MDVQIQYLENSFNHRGITVPLRYTLSRPRIASTIPLYGNLPLWMQEKLPSFEVTEDNDFKVSLAEVEYPKALASRMQPMKLKDVFRVHLGKQELTEASDYEFDTTEAREFYVRLISEEARKNPRATLKNLHLIRQPSRTLPDGSYPIPD